jgi:rRNA maturation protein Nop10
METDKLDSQRRACVERMRNEYAANAAIAVLLSILDDVAPRPVEHKPCPRCGAQPKLWYPMQFAPKPRWMPQRGDLVRAWDDDGRETVGWYIETVPGCRKSHSVAACRYRNDKGSYYKGDYAGCCYYQHIEPVRVERIAEGDAT